MQTFLSDPQNVHLYHDEYLKLLNYYQNTKRPSCFVKYYNINNSKSIKEDKLNTTYDIYSHSEVRFDIYDLTPTNYILPITNMTTPVTDLAGQMYDGIESLVVYTIDKPRIHDLVAFYQPILSDEFFRVSSIRTQVNAIHSETPLKWFELQLEYAPIGDGSNLKIENEFIYDLSTESYLLKSNYEKYMNKLDKIKSTLDLLYPFYNKKYDLYLVDKIYIPIEVNELVIFIKNEFMKKYKDIFVSININVSINTEAIFLYKQKIIT